MSERPPVTPKAGDCANCGETRRLDYTGRRWICRKCWRFLFGGAVGETW